MKISIYFVPILFVFLVGSVFAEELPSLWLEAGKENEIQIVCPEAADWSLRYEHRTFDGGKILVVPSYRTKQQQLGLCVIKIKTPTLDPGIQLLATLLIGDKPYRKVVIASPEPFVDKESWFEQHPIALYDPEKKTAEVFRNNEIPFVSLRSFSDIENVEKAVIVVGQGTDWEREKGLFELLRNKLFEGGCVLVSSPKGKIPVVFDSSIFSMKLSTEPNYLFALATKRKDGGYFALKADRDEIFLVPGNLSGKTVNSGPTILDIRYFDSPSKGRIIIDEELRVSRWNDIETRYYFKLLIETLTRKPK